MSSSEPGAAVRAGAFVPDVDTVGKTAFVPEVVARAAPEVPSRHEPTPLDDYDSTPTEEELRALLQDEMRQTLAAEVSRLRAEDAGSFQQLAQAVREANEERMDRIARRAVELAMTVAERLVRDRIDRDPEVVERALREAVAGIDEGTGITVRVHPDDGAYLRTQEETLAALGIAEVIDDPRQRRGGCLLDVGRAGWDISLVSQLAALQETLERVLEES